MIQTNFFNHKLLVAMPSLQDINYHQSVIYIDEHTKDGAVGLIINKPIDLSVNGLLNHMGIEIKSEADLTQNVFIGGPVAQDQGFVLHPQEHTKKLEISTSKSILTDIGHAKGPTECIITLGYSGWEPGQLEEEVLNNDWLITPYNPDIILRTPINDRWQQAAQSLGIDINKLTNQSGHA